MMVRVDVTSFSLTSMKGLLASNEWKERRRHQLPQTCDLDGKLNLSSPALRVHRRGGTNAAFYGLRNLVLMFVEKTRSPKEQLF